MKNNDDLNFMEAFLKLNKLYKKANDLNLVLKQIDELALVDQPKQLLKNLFKNAEKDGTTFEESFIKSQTLKSARKYLLTLTGVRKQKSFENKSDKVPFECKIVREGKNIEITGNSLKDISSFLQSELSAKWNDKTKKYIILDPKNKKDTDVLYGKIMNKVFYNELRNIKKKEYYEKSNAKTLLVYGRASVLYAGAINREFLASQIDILEQKQESGDKSIHSMYNALVGTENAVKELVEIGILKEKEEEVNSKHSEITTVTVSRFSSDVSKKILSHNIDADVNELKTLLKASTAIERRNKN